MNVKLFKLIVILILGLSTNCEKSIKIKTKPLDVKNIKRLPVNKTSDVSNAKSVSEDIEDDASTINTSGQIKALNPMKVKVPPSVPKKHTPKMIPPDIVQTWASEISEKLYENEKIVVRRDVLLKGFTDMKSELRNGSAIVENVASALEDLLNRRAQAADAVMRRTEKLAKEKRKPPRKYTFDRSNRLGEVKKKDLKDPEHAFHRLLRCRSLQKLQLHNKTHFDAAASVSLNSTSVHISAEVFDCDPQIIEDLYWSEELLPVFKQNYAQDAMMDFQYFCNAKGFLRHYPAAAWSSMFKLSLTSDDDEDDNYPADVYDCRLRPWYVAASGAPRDVLILFDASGSMNQSSNYVHAEQFTLALLSALTDDDHVNVLRFNVAFESPISCFNNTLVPSNHINSAAMMEALKPYFMHNETDMDMVLRESVRLLQREQASKERPPACQQAIVLLTDCVYDNFTALMRELDPSGRIRLFVIWLHDPFGLRDNSREYGEWLSCSTDGYFDELITDSDVTEQVMRVLRVLERPLVEQRRDRLRVFSDVYAHLEDPRRSEYYWTNKENTEQAFRYNELRRNKNRLLSPSQLYKDFMHQVSLDEYGHYYEGQDVDYRLQISVSVPVFDYTTSENITKTLSEEKQRKSTRTYPVNRLLGVVGVDIPIEHLKSILPYYQLGAGGSLFLIDHRGNIVIHNSTKPTFDGDILKPGYRTVDVLDLEQSGDDHLPRNYSREWIEFRRALVLEQSRGSRSLYSKNIFDDGMRAIIEMREYYWRRVLDHYTVVVVLPKSNQRHAVPEGNFTQQLAASALQADLAELFVHPDWLYCKHVDPHFDEKEFEVRHFISRRAQEPDFPMKNLKHVFTPFYTSLMDKTYLCNEELMARLCKEAIATSQWAKEHEEEDTDRDCSDCKLGSTTAFFASESGLTRWQQYHVTGARAEPPSAGEWPRGPTESWYKRAAAAPDTLVVHAPVSPIRKMRNRDKRPPPLGIRHKWLTAARTLGHPEKGIVGVAGYHFYPKHLDDLLKSITNFPCAEEDEDKCEPRCDGNDWTCLIIDEGGWVVAGHSRNEDQLSEEDPAREHLVRLHPHAMVALLNAGVFKLHWIHDYQAVCFPPLDANAAMPLIPSLLKSLWRSVSLLFHVTKEIITILTITSSGVIASGDTEAEKEKRRKRLHRDYEREKYDRLFDERVLINRTRFAACDRSRPLYEFQRTKAIELLKRPPQRCSWPLVGALVPKTNLVLLAIFNLCPYEGRELRDPLNNYPVGVDAAEFPDQLPASRLACWRNKEPFPGRAQHTACYPHNYTQETGYRQCGPWLPDPIQEEDDDNANEQEIEDDVEDIACTIGRSQSLICIIILLSYAF